MTLMGDIEALSAEQTTLREQVDPLWDNAMAAAEAALIADFFEVNPNQIDIE